MSRTGLDAACQPTADVHIKELKENFLNSLSGKEKPHEECFNEADFSSVATFQKASIAVTAPLHDQVCVHGASMVCPVCIPGPSLLQCPCGVCLVFRVGTAGIWSHRWNVRFLPLSICLGFQWTS